MSRCLFQVTRGLSAVPYAQYQRVQSRLKALRMDNQIPNQLILLQHQHVYTTGRRQSWRTNLKWNQDEILHKLGATIVETDRGGDVTYHGPGTLMLYCIGSLHDIRMTVREYVDALEDVLIETVGHYGIKAEGRREGMRGVWTLGQTSSKLAAVGVSASRYIVTHGAALNVSTDLNYFEPIVACGLAGASHTTLCREANHEISMMDVESIIVEQFSKRFQCDVSPKPPTATDIDHLLRGT